jgi:Holliday junction resolvase RusA-like endonuclease
MSDYKFTLPLSVILKRKTKKDAKVSVNLNAFRSMHHRTYTEAKKEYCNVMSDQLNSVDPAMGKMHLHYDFYAAMNNGPDLDNFVGAAKKFFQDAMVFHGFIEDDNVNFIGSNSERYCGVDRKNPRIDVTVTIID